MACERVNHPGHYGGADDPYEAIKVIEAWGLGFNLGNALKYMRRSQHESRGVEDRLTDLRKAEWYLKRAREAVLPADQAREPQRTGGVVFPRVNLLGRLNPTFPKAPDVASTLSPQETALAEIAELRKRAEEAEARVGQLELEIEAKGDVLELTEKGRRSLSVEVSRVRRERDQLESEIADLRRRAKGAEAEVEDWRAGAKAVAEERCGKDEQHCACVADLRRMLSEQEERTEKHCERAEAWKLKAEDWCRRYEQEVRLTKKQARELDDLRSKGLVDESADQASRHVADSVDEGLRFIAGFVEERGFATEAQFFCLLELMEAARDQRNFEIGCARVGPFDPDRVTAGLDRNLLEILRGGRIAKWPNRGKGTPGRVIRQSDESRARERSERG